MSAENNKFKPHVSAQSENVNLSVTNGTTAIELKAQKQDIFGRSTCVQKSKTIQHSQLKSSVIAYDISWRDRHTHEHKQLASI